MQVLITFTKDEYHQLKRDLIENIISDSKKGWGSKYISRETGEELEDDAIRGQLMVAIDKTLKSV